MADTEPEDFPVDRLVVGRVDVCAELDGVNLRLEIAPFDLVLRDAGEPEDTITVETAAVLSYHKFGVTELASLAGQNRHFPVNPEPGYIDASIAIGHGHHPLDVTEMRFGQVDGDALPVDVQARIIVEYEGLSQYRDTDWAFRVLLPVAEIDDILSGRSALRKKDAIAARIARKTKR